MTIKTRLAKLENSPKNKTQKIFFVRPVNQDDDTMVIVNYDGKSETMTRAEWEKFSHDDDDLIIEIVYAGVDLEKI